MPTDRAGKFHSNIQRAMGADKAAMPAPKAKAAPPAMAASSGDEESDPVHEHLKAIHEHLGGGKLHLAHHDGINLTSHHVGEEGESAGPHDHPDAEALGEHLKQFFSEEAQEGMGHSEHQGYSPKGLR